MKELLFACNWERDRKNSWSGTNEALYEHLGKYFHLTDFNTGIHQGIPSVCLLGILQKAGSRICGFDDMGIRRRKMVNRYAADVYGGGCHNVFQFEECPDLEGSAGYLYQDLHVGYIKKMMEEDPALFRVSGFGNLRYGTVCFRERIQRQYYERAAAVFTMGRWLARELVEEYGLPAHKVCHVGGGCNADVSQIDPSLKKGNRILFIGRDFSRKNGPLVVRAFQILKEMKPEVELYLAGPEKPDLSVPGIHVLGNLKQEETVRYYNLCDIFCMPSRFEAYGLVFAEALTFGLPCIGRDAFEMPWFIEEGKTGLLLRREDPYELAELMRRTLESEDMKKHVAKNREYYLREYSWDTVARRIADFIGTE